MTSFTKLPTKIRRGRRSFDVNIDFEPAYNTFNPATRSGSRACVYLWINLIGPKGAVALNITTGWAHSTDQPPKAAPYGYTIPYRPDGAVISYHSKKRKFDFQDKRPDCDLVGACYPDVSYLAAEDAFKVLTDEGIEPLLNHLIDRYLEYWP